MVQKSVSSQLTHEVDARPKTLRPKSLGLSLMALQYELYNLYPIPKYTFKLLHELS